IPFARATRPVDPEENRSGWTLRRTSGEAGQGTDIEAAVREGIASMPQGLVPRLVLVSDGRENRGAAARAAWQARQLGVPIDTVALKGREQPALHLDTVTLPSLAFTGEKFPIELTVSAPRSGEGS